MIILISISLAILLYCVLTYNSLVALKNHIKDAWSNIDTELKRRYNLIPNLVSTVKGYAAHEKDLFESVTKMRSQCMSNNGSPDAQAKDESQLVDGLKQLMVVVEKYPDLKADKHFLELQKELVNTEDRIQAARRFYNGNVRDYRNKQESFPSNLIASGFNFEAMSFFEVEPAVAEPPQVSMAAG
jgi:LemA protein